jgi:hypothetical protein
VAHESWALKNVGGEHYRGRRRVRFHPDSLPHPLAVTAALAAVAGSFGFLVVVWIAFLWVAGDTPFVLDGSNAFLTCLSQHDYDACGYTGKLNYWGLMSPIGDWSLLQHVPDLISIKLGANGHPVRTRILELLGVAAVVGSVGLAWVVLSHALRFPAPRRSS